MKQIDWNRYTPPGREKSDFIAMFWLWFIAGIIWSLRFFVNLIGALDRLYASPDGSAISFSDRKLIPGRIIAPFGAILEGSFNLFPICWLFLVLEGFACYWYFRKDTMSIYLMRRLSNPWELHRRCWGKPLILSLYALGTQAVLYVIYFLFYLVFTPRGHLPF